MRILTIDSNLGREIYLAESELKMS